MLLNYNKIVDFKIYSVCIPETHFTNQPQTIKHAVQKLMENKISIGIEHKRLFTTPRSVSNYLFDFSLSRITRSEQFYLKPFQVVRRAASRQIKGCFYTGCIRGANIFQKSRNNFKILGARTAMWNKFPSEDP